jgi:hypothetical protein
VASKTSGKSGAAGKKPPATSASNTGRAAGTAAPRLLSGGNPQIAKGHGDAPVQAWIAAAPGWKGELGARLDAIITASSPGVAKAVKWNSPFYGVRPGEWFLCLHCFTKFVRVTFFQGASLKPPPEGTSAYPAVRYYDIAEGALDEKRFSSWVKQARKLPLEKI